ncbi:MAG: glycine cleavage system aminomethyltransferase GcvT [Proteobacteria bacterium]|nr:glycine cleavage system aminomethyltransferase GcvT [Pseudomonadota bacterium]MBU1584599.1 glycine cleavage system aminomethyltransferase GcvT [Pseudomonadota bacterium]MBU2452492.1 glycine cleavage system aminomethyltransferase GcvT [Pseudomonadota bacterium]MBU2627278.1 glycine cleavage system aminomethyltransferase GcvT [Pseudomonadota bacterium]
MSNLLRTVFYKTHQDLDAKIVEFGGWEMPIQYPDGIINEHLATRKKAGIFDVSHMGRLFFKGKDTLAFLQHVLSNNAAALGVGESQYTLIQNETGGAIDDAYLYRFLQDEYLLVVNASNREKDVAHFKNHLAVFQDIEMVDKTFDIAMISLQGPLSKSIIQQIVTGGTLPEPARNSLSIADVNGVETYLARTGYTGEPLGFELFVENKYAVAIWNLLMEKGALPIGLGARDTLRLEACLPLYGHELGTDHDGSEIPVFASKLSKFAVSFSPLKGDFIGKDALYRQYLAFKDIVAQKFEDVSSLPRMVMPLAITGKGIAREGYKVFLKDRHVGYITSGTMIPFQEPEGSGLDAKFKEEPKRRAVAMALIDSSIPAGKTLEIDIRKKRCDSIVVPYHMSSEAPPFVRSLPQDQLKKVQLKQGNGKEKDSPYPKLAKQLISKAMDNHTWRQKECINLIPSEMSQSYGSRLLSISDPVNRYAEHKEIKAFSREDVFYYQGTEFIREIETLLNKEFQTFLGCRNIESRVISGQMANTAFFSAYVDFLNRSDRKNEQRRIRKIMNNHIIKGGHLSAQPMGALRDFVARDPKTEKPAVINFPVEKGNPYKMDIQACEKIIKDHQPELVILGKSMIIHKEPVAEIRRLVDEFAPDCLVMYDMAHVLGLYGPHFQEPLKQGAHIVTGSTHKTYFGTQRGVIASDFNEDDLDYELWEAVQRRTFPGSVSNHHLGTMTGLLFCAYEMNHFKEAYQKAVILNAKAFADALKEQGLDVAGDPSISFTDTHQVILNVGYGKGAKIARELEENNIIVNYQATPVEEGFTASGALRMGVSEMTRFGMKEKDFQVLAAFMADLIKNRSNIKNDIKKFRGKFIDMLFCFKEQDIEEAEASLLGALR